jgi:hypothetical protein
MAIDTTIEIFFVAQKVSITNLSDQKFSIAFGHQIGQLKNFNH